MGGQDLGMLASVMGMVFLFWEFELRLGLQDAVVARPLHRSQAPGVRCAGRGD